MEIKIYGLVDPRDNTVRYVGKTKRDLNIRLSRHINDKPIHNNYKYNWICNLKKNGLKPIIIELEICDETNWVDREQYWIQQFKTLTNLTSGGEGINFFTDEIIIKISDSLKKKWEDPEYKKNISKKRIEYWSDPKNRLNQSKKLKGISISNEHKENISLGRKDGKPIMINGIKYRNIKYAVKVIPINRNTLKRRLMSKKFPEYCYE